MDEDPQPLEQSLGKTELKYDQLKIVSTGLLPGGAVVKNPTANTQSLQYYNIPLTEYSQNDGITSQEGSVVAAGLSADASGQ